MIAFRVDDMSCSHCVQTITRAVQAVDDRAEVTADLATHEVRIATPETNREAMAQAIAEAGYTLG